MKAKLDCEAKYVVEQDPWGIGQADSPRYDLYVEWIRARAQVHGSVLDVGCGFGAMLARLRPDFEHLHGIELSAEAVAKGAQRYRFIDFEQGSIDALERTHADRERFDAIIFSDVLSYVDEAGRRASLRWIAEHLQRDGFAFIALYSPGGSEYPTPEEVRVLVEREFVVERSELLETEHLMLLARPRRRLAALTLDYETWQPVPAGRRIDWDADVFTPTDALLDACDAEGARLTIFAELGEHAYLREHEPQVAARMEAQWRDAVERGHDVQMHLHPNWLPELGARFERGHYVWNELLTRAEDHPDLETLLGRLKQVLEETIRPVDPSYATVAFRAGGYEAQPFRRLAHALDANGLWCDSSVYHGGHQPGIYHDYNAPFDTHQPWYASHADPQLPAPAAEHGIVELPVATFARNDRWTFDNLEGARFGEKLLTLIEAERTAGPSLELARLLAAVRRFAAAASRPAGGARPLIDRVLAQRRARGLAREPAGRRLEDDFYVAVGHSKADLEIPAIRDQLRVLREARVEVVGLAEMARIARDQLERCRSSEVEAQARDHARLERLDMLCHLAHERPDPISALGEALAREGHAPRWVTMIAHEHPHGHGPHARCAHEVIELTLAEHSRHVLDPIADVRFPFALHELIDEAKLADGVERPRDAAHQAREHHLYSTSFWYRRVVAVSVRADPRAPRRYVPARWAAHALEPRYQALASMRTHGWHAIRRLRPA